MFKSQTSNLKFQITYIQLFTIHFVHIFTLTICAMKYIYLLLMFGFVSIQTFSQKTKFTQQQLADANTASQSTVLTSLEKDVLMYINLVRMYPKQFFYQYADSMAVLAGINNKHDNFISLKKILLEDNKSEPLVLNDNLYKMAKEMRDDVGPHGIVGHTDSKKRNFAKRSKLYKLDDKYTAENIDFGRDSALEIVFSWLFDIDVESLGHRENLLNPVYKIAGVKFGDHKKYEFCCVLDLASN